MNQVAVTYEGNQRCAALNTKNGKRIAVDCPMTKGEEFGPDGLVAAGLGSCMLISMATFAERHGLDVTGARIDLIVSLSGQPQARISAVDATVYVPKPFTQAERTSLEKAAATCPIKHSFRPETQISTHFEFGGA